MLYKTDVTVAYRKKASRFIDKNNPLNGCDSRLIKLTEVTYEFFYFASIWR